MSHLSLVAIQRSECRVISLIIALKAVLLIDKIAPDSTWAHRYQN